MSYLFFAALVGVLGYMALRWFVSADPARIAFVARTAAIAIVVVVAGMLVFTGRIGSLYWLGMLAGPAAMSWYRRRKAAQGGFREAGEAPPRGNRSEAETDWVRMALDIESGRLDGLVKQGPFAGRMLSGLTPTDLMQLYRGCSADPDTLRLLEAYLDRRLGPDWHDQAGRRDGGAGGTSRGAMDRAEALEILGLRPGASANEIKAAHRRLMGQVHPDRGGSTFLAAKINQARDLLLGD